MLSLACTVFQALTFFTVIVEAAAATAHDASCALPNGCTDKMKSARDQVLLQLAPALKTRRLAETAASSPDGGNSSGAGTGSCLCVFDIDRTLTGRQGAIKTCPRNRIVRGVPDDAYGHGDLTLSALANEGINRTFCVACYLGICSAGGAGGTDSEERKVLVEEVLRTPPQDELIRTISNATSWSHGKHVQSPLVYGKSNRRKQDAVEEIRQWYGENGITIAAERVYFFGDRTENMEPFRQKGFNAREISCASRDWHIDMVGFCGATPEEIVDTPGVSHCSDPVTPAPTTPLPTLPPAPTPAPPPTDEPTVSPTTAPTPAPPTLEPTPMPTHAPTVPLTCEDIRPWTNGYSACQWEQCADDSSFRDKYGRGCDGLKGALTKCAWYGGYSDSDMAEMRKRCPASCNIDCRYTEADGCTSSGWTCEGYEKRGWCRDGYRTTGNYAFGAGLKYPEKNCCACGGGAVGKCHNADIRRRRRESSMCSCRRRSNSDDLPAGWQCLGNFIVESPSTSEADVP